MKLQLDLDKQSLENVKKFPERFTKGLLSGFRKAMYMLEAETKKGFGQSGNLKVRTGRLRNSIKTEIDVNNNGLEGIIGTNVIYAPVHEFGARIRPVRASILRFEERGIKFAKEVNIPSRPFLKPVIDANKSKIEGIIQKEIIKEVNK